MKRVYIHSLVILTAFCVPQTDAQWVQTYGPYGHNVSCFAIVGPNLYVGTYDGLFITGDNGASWQQQLKYGTVQSLAVSGTHLIISAFDSFSGGASVWVAETEPSWTVIAERREDFVVSSFALVGTDLYAGTRSDGMLRWIDSSSSCTAMNAGLTSLYVRSLLAIDSILLAGTCGGGVFRSTDGGANWAAVNGGLTNLFISSLAHNGMNVFAATYDGSVFRSTDNGSNWEELNTFSTDPLTISLAASGTDVFVGTYGLGVFRSTDTGSTWEAVNTGLSNAYVSSVFAENGVLYAGTASSFGGPGGVFISTDKGSTWTPLEAPLSTEELPYVWGLSASEEHVFASTHLGVFETANDGINWKPADPSFPEFGQNQLINAGPDMFVGTGDRGVLRSTDKGVTWTAVSNGLPKNSDDTTQYEGIPCLASIGQYLFAGTGNCRVYRSTDRGSSWDSTSFWDGSGNSLNSLCAFTSAEQGRDTVVLAGTMGWYRAVAGWVYSSTDFGTTWTVVGMGRGVQQFVVCGTYVFASLLNYGTGMKRSSDCGRTWTETGLADPHVSSLASSGENLFALISGTVLLSTDFGSSWRNVSDGLPSEEWLDPLLVTSENLLIGTPTGVWHRSLAELITSVGPVSAGAPLEFSLHQNYPNPFNPSTTIRYELPKSSMVRLTVYDILGREVARLVNERKHAGSYELKFDATGSASGMYVYRLQAGDLTQSKKFVILK